MPETVGEVAEMGPGPRGEGFFDGDGGSNALISLGVCVLSDCCKVTILPAYVGTRQVEVIPCTACGLAGGREPGADGA
jgi:hypothetical protein